LEEGILTRADIEAIDIEAKDEANEAVSHYRRD
jgi:hypothetical protein